ncbi:multiheme c-type cytochrome [Tundrisphaera lichenicola]|uniref:multiheme c-type cytochrome n=1 Tax=Tundrisphaera lichenicola TaxID=2029860 RepID=UPI003EBB5A3A
MTRTSFRPVAAVGLVAVVLIYVGCSKPREAAIPAPVDRVDSSSPSASTSNIEVSATEKIPKVIAEWSTTPPTGILLVSGEQNGYLQPCGCTDGQLGGLGRRFDLIDKLRSRGWPVVPIDLGNLIANPAGSRGGFEQEKIKFDTAIKALSVMKYEAVALGAEDLKLGVFQTLGVLFNVKEPKFLAANLTPGDGFEETIHASLITKAGPISVGVTAVIAPESFEALSDPDKAALLTVKPPEEVIPGVLENLKAKSQVCVLLVQGSIEEARRLGEKFPGFDLIVSKSIYSEGESQPEMLNDGKTILINVGQKGKFVGVVGIFPGKDPMLRYVLQPLDQNGLREAESMRALIDEEMQAVLKSVGVVENFPRRANNAGSPGATYVGAETCKSCHPKTFDKWASTKHARAFEALLTPKRNREYDAECISCHTTGFKYESGWISAEQTPYLKGNQCENCHGPASLHIAEPDNLVYRKPMAMSAELADSNGFCINCHDEDNDHNFTFPARYAQIYHKGLDSYEDPKVHQPQALKGAAEGR